VISFAEMRSALVELRPDLGAGPPHEEAHGFPRVAEGEYGQACPAVLAALRITHHRPVAIVDLALLARGRRDDRARLDDGATQLLHESPHTRVAIRKAVRVDEILPDRHCVAPTADRLDDQLAVRLARARGRRTRRANAAESVDTSGVMAGFDTAFDSGGPTCGRPTRRTAMPAALR